MNDTTKWEEKCQRCNEPLDKHTNLSCSVKEKTKFGKEYHRKWRLANKEKNAESHKKCQQKDKLQALINYSENPPKCMCCGETEVKFLTIDHVNNDGKEHRKEIRSRLTTWLKKNNYPSGFQTLCFNCNCGKSINKGICPHQDTLKKI